MPKYMARETSYTRWNTRVFIIGTKSRTHSRTNSNRMNLFACVRFRLCSRLWACSIKYWNEISEKGCLRPPEHSEGARTHSHSFTCTGNTQAHRQTQAHQHIHALVIFLFFFLNRLRYVYFVSVSHRRHPARCETNTMRNRSNKIDDVTDVAAIAVVVVVAAGWGNTHPFSNILLHGNLRRAEFVSAFVMQSFRCARLDRLRDQLTIWRRRRRNVFLSIVRECEIVVSVSAMYLPH